MPTNLKQFPWESITAVATGLLALATIGAVLFAAWQIRDAVQARTAQDYVDLRKRFLEIDTELDKVNRSLAYSEAGSCPQWHVLKRYWYFSETEWKVAQIDDAQRSNWEEAQLPQVANSLRRPAYRAAFLEMRDSPARRFGDKDGHRFVDAVTREYERIRKNAAQRGESLSALEDRSDFKAAPSCQDGGVADGVRWFRDSAEMKAVYTETYLAASDVARDAAKRLPPKSWGVILDIDETLLDNSEYQKELAAKGAPYSDTTFQQWLARQEAGPLPGAAEFVRVVNEDWHGRVALVTNQTPDQCAETKRRLQTLAIHYERMLCDEAHTQDKNARFIAVQQGDPVEHIPPMQVVLWIGDNIRDFPELSQASSGNPARFGTRYFVLPNPMYGSWVTVPPR